jgi:MT0933-like antitoxin protein
MPLMRRVAALAATVAAARQYARQNPEKVNRYADQAAAFVNSRTAGRYRRQIDSALRQVRKETSIPGRSQQTQFGDRKTQQYPSYREDRPREPR